MNGSEETEKRVRMDKRYDDKTKTHPCQSDPPIIHPTPPLPPLPLLIPTPMPRPLPLPIPLRYVLLNEVRNPLLRVG